jgi:hypothetical protein
MIILYDWIEYEKMLKCLEIFSRKCREKPHREIYVTYSGNVSLKRILEMCTGNV